LTDVFTQSILEKYKYKLEYMKSVQLARCCTVSELGSAMGNNAELGDCNF